MPQARCFRAKLRHRKTCDRKCATGNLFLLKPDGRGFCRDIAFKSLVTNQRPESSFFNQLERNNGLINWRLNSSGQSLVSLIHELRQGWVLFKRTCEFCGIKCTKHFIEFVFVETNEVVRSNSNVILTRQTCGHRSSRVAKSKSRALAFYFSVRIWYVFFISICRGKSDLGLCTKRSPTDTFASHPIHVPHLTDLVLHFCPPYPALHIYPTYLSHPIFLVPHYTQWLLPLSSHLPPRRATPMGHDWL